MSYIAYRTETKDEIRDMSDELKRGDVAQLGERRPCTAEASGSIPLISTISGIAYCVLREEKEFKK
jgi:hypothetical protein